jgi:hypothetical protein
LNEDLEIKGRYSRSQQDRGALVRTIVAMANTHGGRILLQSVEGDPATLDLERLDQMVNTYVEPRLQGVTSTVKPDGAVEIVVPESALKPHVFVAELDYQLRGRTRGAFFPGQIWVRRHSRTEPAGAADIERMVRAAAGRVLQALSESISNPAFSLQRPAHDGHASASEPAAVTLQDVTAEALLRTEDRAELAVRVTTDPDAAPVNIDINRTYPFTTSALGEALGKGTNWAAAAVRALHLKNDLGFHYPVRNADGKVVVNKYSEAALQQLRDKLASDPEWNPWAA